jgi:FNIP Repeat
LYGNFVVLTNWSSVSRGLLTHLTTGKYFNQPVDKLPPTLTHLTTGYSFNQPVDKLPPTLTHLTIGYQFNQPVDKLPPTLTHHTVTNNLSTPFPALALAEILHPNSLTSQLVMTSTNLLMTFHPHLLISQ